jgi:hypothetical protein
VIIHSAFNVSQWTPIVVQDFSSSGGGSVWKALAWIGFSSPLPWTLQGIAGEWHLNLYAEQRTVRDLFGRERKS